MSIVSMDKCQTLQDIEAAYWEILSNKDEKFVIPADFLSARRGALHDASRLQLIITLARQELNGDFLDFSKSVNPESLIDNIANYSPGVAAVRLSKGIRIGDRTFSRRDVLKAAVERMQAADAAEYEKVIRGRIIDLICVAGSKIQYLRPLFSADGVVKTPPDMTKSIRELIDFVNKQSSQGMPETLTESLGLFCSELVGNTQDHATSDHLGNKYHAHVEGLMLGWTRLDEDIFSSDFEGNQELREYWDRELSTTENNKTSLRAFQISFFDSGPGFASRISGKSIKQMNLEEEREYLTQCLSARTTTKFEDAAGQGLQMVLRELQKIGGLIRIRTGRMSIYNQFKKNDTSRNLLDFKDWSSEPLAPVVGSVVAILIPLRAV
ncbi:hypothetical protein NJC38_24855 [Pseudomonas sp. 21LCFQ010]|uniref:hypothetical protein n=1 Tax=Pseudomonas sp. 21LCFQ010 TaxID=2957506 RepID=UPI0020976969|nr:hypothetical protein [Pseudomonas sp. 21LCFQ010]MCO8165374.1 hypothetical protein [Pseudomonas sp. 21LCFQ010]